MVSCGKVSADRLATFRATGTPEAANLLMGTAIRFASGRCGGITRIESKGRHLEISVDGPLSPHSMAADQPKPLPMSARG